eukprot:m.208553 g.208553  ORF g.208553 m.208553 type:complete len:64 (-) comp25421_c0_seq4:169-360(-)
MSLVRPRSAAEERDGRAASTLKRLVNGILAMQAASGRPPLTVVLAIPHDLDHCSISLPRAICF